MTLIGIELKRPGFVGLTRAVAMAVALWAALTLSPLGAKDAVGAGANLAAIVFGCVSNEVGIQVGQGGRNLLLNITGCVLVLAIYWVAFLAFYTSKIKVSHDRFCGFD